MEEFHREGSNLDTVAGMDGMEGRLFEQAAAGELDLKQPARQRCGIDRGIDLLQRILSRLSSR
jgi:hypothetical protein